MDTEQSPEEAVLRMNDVIDRVRVKVSPATIRNWIKRQQFPKPKYRGPHPTWTESEFEEWERSRPKK